MKILCTGGAGFIGSNLCNHLAVQGHEIIAVDDLSLGKWDNLDVTPNIVKCEADVLDLKQMQYIFAQHSPNHVVHLAAKSSAPMFENPVGPCDINLRGFHNIIWLCKAYDCPVTYASTSSIYSGNSMPFVESQIVTPKTFYEYSLYSRELLAEIYMLKYGMRTIGLRFFSVYGPHEEHKGNFANLVSQFIWAYQKGEAPIIYGTGEQTRDFTHVDDVVHAIELSITNKEMRGIYNVGTGKSYAVTAMAEMVRRELKSNLKPKLIPNPISQYVQDTQADINKIIKIGFRPTIELWEGISKLCAKD